jgi:hypothetical protein
MSLSQQISNVVTTIAIDIKLLTQRLFNIESSIIDTNLNNIQKAKVLIQTQRIIAQRELRTDK